MFKMDKLRQEIDLLDDQIIELLDSRFTKTQAIGEYKKANNIPVLNEGREQVIIDKIKKLDLENEDLVIATYKSLFSISKKGQSD